MAGTLGPMNPIRSPEVMHNLHILDLANRIDGFLRELGNCASATRHETSTHDLARSVAMHAHPHSRLLMLGAFVR